MIVIDPKKHKPNPDHARKLVERIGLPQATVAASLALDARTFRRYLQEPGTKGATPMPFAVQVILELMAKGVAAIKH